MSTRIKAPRQLVGEKEALRICREALPGVVGRLTLRHWRETVDGLHVRPRGADGERGYYVAAVLREKLHELLTTK